MIINNQPSPSQMMFQPPMAMSHPNTIKAQVIVKEMFDQSNDIWPASFMVCPKRGDTVQSDSGRRLTVLEIVHSTQNGEPLLQVEIGVDRTDNTPTGGGGGDLL